MSFAPSLKKVMSPRDFGRVIGVSESSVKRWIDAGEIPAWVTRGGHRRLDFLPALRALEKTGRRAMKPSFLGLSPESADSLQDPETFADRLFLALYQGKAQEVVRMILASVIAGSSEPAEFFDGPVRAAINRIGELWDGAQRGIFAEHRATQILLAAVDRLSELYSPPSNGIVAVGGSFEGDPGELPSRMAATVLVACDIQTVNLGSNTPVPAFLDAVEETGAALVWVSVGCVTSPQRQGRALEELARVLWERDCRLIVGGRELERMHVGSWQGIKVGACMRDLADFALEVARLRRDAG